MLKGVCGCFFIDSFEKSIPTSWPVDTDSRDRDSVGIGGNLLRGLVQPKGFRTGVTNHLSAAHLHATVGLQLGTRLEPFAALHCLYPKTLKRLLSSEHLTPDLVESNAWQALRLIVWTTG